MAATIQALFVTPAIAIARLGGSTTPLHAYNWVDAARPRFDGETEIVPSWTLVVRPDASVAPVLPESITFRDGSLIRPVAPFFEIWVRLGEVDSAPTTWVEAPLTIDLLADQGLSLAALRLSVTARNLKASRRSGDPAHAFGNWDPVVIIGNDFSAKDIKGKSPPGAAVPMIPLGRNIPLGKVQMLRSSAHVPDQPWSESVRTDTLRFRYTPARGEFYGPPEAAEAAPALRRNAPAVPDANAFLDRAAGWHGASTGNLVQPGDTYDAIDERSPRGPSLGVVDDTCEVHFDVNLKIGAEHVLSARAVAFVGPPDFAPDRRPFYTLADELNDRDGNATQRNAALDDRALADWVEDLFERIYETVSLFNLDHYRALRSAELPADRLQPEDIDHGTQQNPANAMGGRDVLRSQVFQINAPTPNDPLPLSQHARMRHRALSDLQNLISLVALDAQSGRHRLRELVRRPFEVESFETASETSMRMPPFMRHSNARPLTLASWQYELLMRWADSMRQEALMGPAALGAALVIRRPRSAAAMARRAAVLEQLNMEDDNAHP